MERKDAPGRPGIEHHVYINQIQSWLNEGIRLDEITATMLQKSVGGQYKKVVSVLDEFKAGYETKELSELPDVPETLSNALNAASLEIWRIVCEAKNKEVADIRGEFEKDKATLSRLAVERLDIIDELEQAVQSLQDELAILSPELGELREHLAAATSRAEGLAGALEDKTQQLTETKQALQDVTVKHNALSSDHDLQKTELSELASKAEQQNIEIERLNGQLSETNQSLVDVIAQRDDLRVNESRLETELNNAKMKVVDVNELRHQEGRKAEAEISRLTVALDGKAKELEEAKATTASLTATNTQQRDLLSAAESKIAELENVKANAASLEATIKQQREQLAATEKRAEKLEGDLLNLVGSWQEKLAKSDKDEDDKSADDKQ